MAALSLAIISITTEIQAAPFTYEFNLPNWGSGSGDYNVVFGTHGVLDLTVDNGATTNLSQTYLNTQITRLSLTTVGGTFSNTWSNLDTFITDTSSSYLSTDAWGIITLNLLAASTDSAFVANNTGGYLQLGVITPSGGYSTLATSTADWHSSAFYDPYVNGFTGVSQTGQLVETPTATPIPAAAWLFCSGLFGLIGAARHKAA